MAIDIRGGAKSAHSEKRMYVHPEEDNYENLNFDGGSKKLNLEDHIG